MNAAEEAEGTTTIVMRGGLTILLFLAMTINSVLCQETRRTVTHSAQPDDDKRENNDKVPEVYALAGQFERIVILRFKYNVDLLPALEKEVAQKKIRNGVILAAIGSVRGYQVHQVSSRNLPPQDTYVKNPSEPADLVSMNGYIVNGRTHAHITLATPDRVIAGHLEPGTQVLTFVIVTIGVMNQTNLDHVDDMTYR